MSNRPETGPMRFGCDWTGVFMRGDNAFNYANCLERILSEAKHKDINTIDFVILHDLMTLLQESNDQNRSEKSEKEVQKLKEFLDCLPYKEPSGSYESCSQGDTTDEATCTII